MCIYQPSFFDESERMEALSKLNDPLEKLVALVDFELFRPVLAKALPREEKTAGAKPYDLYSCSDTDFTAAVQTLRPASRVSKPTA
jgi:hypothetical protein